MQGTRNNVAQIQGLVVRYGQFTALNALSVNVPEGCVGLLGPNGAGKTTLLKTLLGFVQPSGGRATVFDKDISTEGRSVRQKIGLMPEQDCHIPGMSAVAYVAYAGELSGMPPDQALRRAHEVLEYCGLGEARYRNVETYSTGMKQRIKFAQALVHGPKLLLLDEPTNGLDPRGREEMLDLIRSVSHGKGLNVIISSHLLPDIERTCDEVIVIMNGTLRAQGQIKELKQIEGQPVDVELRESSAVFASAVTAGGMQIMEIRPRVYRILASGRQEETGKKLFDAARASGAQIRGMRTAERSLEEVFLSAVMPGVPPVMQV